MEDHCAVGARVERGNFESLEERDDFRVRMTVAVLAAAREYDVLGADKSDKKLRGGSFGAMVSRFQYIRMEGRTIERDQISFNTLRRIAGEHERSIAIHKTRHDGGRVRLDTRNISVGKKYFDIRACRLW